MTIVERISPYLAFRIWNRVRTAQSPALSLPMSSMTRRSHSTYLLTTSRVGLESSNVRWISPSMSIAVVTSTRFFASKSLRASAQARDVFPDPHVPWM